MTTKDTGGPAFPTPEDWTPQGNLIPGSSGMTLRDYFAMHAPNEVPHWFFPKMREKPEHRLVDKNGNVYKSAYLADEAVGAEGWWDANNDARKEWEKDYVVSKVAQWPWFWADIQLEARKA